MDKKKKELYLNLLAFVISPIIIVAGALIITFAKSNRTVAAGALVILFGAAVILFRGYYMLVRYFVNKDKTKEENKARFEKENLIDEARQAFRFKTDYPQTNTVKLVKAGIEFFAEGVYVCEKDFKNIPGNHLAFEIKSTVLKISSEDYDDVCGVKDESLKTMPEDYDDVCDIESTGIIVSVGYHDGEALEKYANDNGVILQDTLENSIDKTITLTPNKGYAANVWTAEEDDIDYGFVKILSVENDVLKVFFSLTVPYGLCDTVEGVVELKKDTLEQTHDINSLIDRIKRKRYNTIEVGADEVQAIKQANPFLPESYIAFLTEVGFADCDWIDIGWNAKTPTNLDDYQTDYVKEVFAKYKNEDENDYYFIGIDNSDCYYAFSRKADDKKVYAFSNSLSSIITHETFEEFLKEILST